MAVSRTVTVRMEKRGQIEGYSDADPRDLATGCGSFTTFQGGDETRATLRFWLNHRENGGPETWETCGVSWWGLFCLCCVREACETTSQGRCWSTWLGHDEQDARLVGKDCQDGNTEVRRLGEDPGHPACW